MYNFHDSRVVKNADSSQHDLIDVWKFWNEEYVINARLLFIAYKEGKEVDTINLVGKDYLPFLQNFIYVKISKIRTILSLALFFCIDFLHIKLYLRVDSKFHED